MGDEERRLQKSEAHGQATSIARDRGADTPHLVSEATAMQRFLSCPPMDLLDENGRAPTRDRLYDDDRH